ncbi:protein FAR1-RELATED SEQUENCE 9 [Brachypodium distachyon]|uniref:protein FAR1-RELATED SEQUENCE 9 n=1 Tax=Brachypodium distachyon TaxID=15368 RepID=UPI00052FF93F|nr:protein FAR1-RELATED SEQUENCE 9 [Brachypodium distachyon]|eukprot:XP_010233003.1 protein FAR1-RELATED SEQUENCE 9 [Brachypodium distachyon]
MAGGRATEAVVRGKEAGGGGLRDGRRPRDGGGGAPQGDRRPRAARKPAAAGFEMAGGHATEAVVRHKETGGGTLRGGRRPRDGGGARFEEVGGILGHASAYTRTSSADLRRVNEPATPESEQNDDDGVNTNAKAHSTLQPPSVHMKFDSFDAAYEHYSVFALRKGFGIRREYSKKLVDGRISRVMVVCTRAGKPRLEKVEDEKTENIRSIVKKRKRSRTTRTDCKAHMYLRCTVAEFEGKWVAMLQNYEMEDNDHLQELWENRACWVLAYYMHDFYPFLQSTQRSEGFNAVHKKYVNPQNSLTEFARQYTSIQEKIMSAENKEEAETATKDQDLWGYHPVERQMHKIYTHNLFLRFQHEVRETTSYDYEHVGGNRHMLTSLRGRVGKYDERSFHVEACKSEGIFICECCKYYRDGMVCCHVMRVMMQIGVHMIPDRYILERWTWDEDADLIQPDAQPQSENKAMPEESKRKMRYATLNSKFKDLSKQACMSDDENRIVAQYLKDLGVALAACRKREKRKAAKSATVDSPNAPSNSSNFSATCGWGI